jgi:aqualysin 1
MRSLSIFAMAALTLSACQPDITQSPVPVAPSEAASLSVGDLSTVAPRGYIVVFKNQVTDVDGLVNQLSRQHGVRAKFRYGVALKGFAADLPPQAVDAIARNPNVAYVEPDLEVFAIGSTEGSQSLVSSQWGLDRIDQRVRTRDHLYTWENTGAGVEAYILDTGIRYAHTEFGGRASLFGDYVQDGSPYLGDCHGHGTHVAGTVGGTVHGVAKGVTLKDARVLGCSGSGWSSGIIAAIDDITRRKVDNPQIPMVGNMSLGSTGLNTAYLTAIDNSVSKGVNWSIAAGNASMDACGYSPAAALSALTVGSSTSSDARSSFSNFGPCVDLFAPGSSILAATYESNTATGTKSGTSMAAPHVAGVVALYLAANPTASAYTVHKAMVDAATPGVLTSIGAGSPNLLLFSLVATVESSVPAGHHVLQVGVGGNGGTGTVTGTGISCTTAAGGDCSEPFAAGTSVTLTASPGANSQVSWAGGGCVVSGNSCTVSMSQARTVMANFNAPRITVVRQGTNLGTVTSSPTGINCGSDCNEFYALNTSVTLTATPPATGGTFTGWSGCSSALGNTCTVNLTTYSTRTIYANFSSGTSYNLTVTNSGGGTVSSSPSGISCGTTCSALFTEGTSVTLSATPASGHRFKEWGGACSGTSTSCQVGMNASKSVTATFEALPMMHVSALDGRAVVGSKNWTAYAKPTVRVSSSSAALSGAVVRLSWSGAASGSGSCTTDATGSCEVAISGLNLRKTSLNVVVTGVTHSAYGFDNTQGVFERTITTNSGVLYPLDVSVSGSGTVTSSPAGISCGTQCSASFESGTSVTLQANPSAGQRLLEWTGACTGSGSCVVSMTAARSVGATFISEMAPTVHVAALTGSGALSGRNWTANATVTVRDQGGATVAGTTVSFNLSGASSGTRSCITDSSGSCAVSVTGLNTKKTTQTFSVTGISGGGVVYNPAANVVTSVTVTKP